MHVYSTFYTLLQVGMTFCAPGDWQGSRSYAACFLVVMLDSFDNARQQQEEEWRSFHLLLRRRPAFCITRENRFGPRQRRADIILASDDVEIERDRRIDLFVAFIKK